MGICVAVLDDVGSEARELAQMIEASTPHRDGLEVITFFSPEALVAYLAAGNRLDVLFVDICLGSSNGVDLVGRLSAAGSMPQIVYASGFDEYHTRVYETRHASFLKKPICQQDVDMALTQALRRLEEDDSVPLVLNHDHVTEVVHLRDILYVESDRRHVVVHTKTGSCRSYGKLSDILERLPSHIVRCHQSYLVNLDAVERLGSDSVVLVTGDAVPVSRRWRTAVRDALFARIREGR